MATEAKLLTRAQYMAREVTHEQYYHQFVTPEVIRTVIRVFGLKRIQQSADPHFNDIPLAKWESVGLLLPKGVYRMLSRACGRTDGVYWTSDTVCVAKAAARVIRGR